MVTNLIDHVQGEHDYAKVVDDHRLLEVERFAVLHQTRSECRDKVDVGKDDHGLRERGGHERPVLNSRVYKEIRGSETDQFPKFPGEFFYAKIFRTYFKPAHTCFFKQLIIKQGNTRGQFVERHP